MSKRLFFLLPLIALPACGKDEVPIPAKIVIDDKKKADDPPISKKEEVKKAVLPKKIEEKRVQLFPLDLRSHGLFAIIDAPAGTQIDSIGFGELQLTASDGYSFSIRPGTADLAKIKEDLTREGAAPVHAFHAETKDSLFLETRSGENPTFRFHANVTIAGKPYQLEKLSAPGINLGQARRNFEAARSLRQPPELQKALQDQIDAEKELIRLGGEFTTLPDGSRQLTFFICPELEDKHMDLVAGIRDLSWVSLHVESKLTAAGVQKLEELPRLKWLSLANAWVTDQVVSAAANLRGLRTLRIANTPITDFTLRSLSNLTELESLELEGTRIGDNGLRNLLPLKKLNRLRLKGSDVSDKGAPLLKEFAELRELSLADTAITDAAVVELMTLKALLVLDLTDTVVTDKAVESLVKIESLVEVFLTGTNISALGVARLQQERTKLHLGRPWPVDEMAPAAVSPPTPLDLLTPPDPEALIAKFKGKITRDEKMEAKPIVGVDLQGTKVTDRDLAHLRGLSKLMTLNLEGCPSITDAALPYLDPLRDLEELNLRGTSVRGDGLVHLKDMASLTRIFLSPSTLLTSRQLEPLLTLPNLERLSFGFPENDYPVLAVLGRFPKLVEVNLEGVHLSNRKLALIKDLKNLEGLVLSRFGSFSDRGLASLKGLVNLKALVMRNYQGSNGGLANLKAFTNLKVLELGGPYIGDSGLNHLGDLHNLERVRLDGVNITERGLAAFRNLGNLIEIGLTRSPITDRGLEALLAVKDVEILDLSYTKITDAGLAKLKGLDKIRTLRLDGVAIDGSGLKALEDWEHLYRLTLIGCKLSDAGLKAIAGLEKLRVLDLSRTPITADGLSQLKQHRLLEEISLIECPALSDVDVLKEFRALKRVWLLKTKIAPAKLEELRKTGISVDGVL